MTGAKATVVFCCKYCGAEYQTQQFRPRVRCFGSFKCQICGNEVYSWHGDYDYIDWTAIEAISVLRKSGAKKTIN